MDRRALEALSSAELQRLITEAAAVLAERHATAAFVEIKKELESASDEARNEMRSEVKNEIKKIKKEAKREVKKESCPVFNGRGTKRGFETTDEEEAGTSRQPGSSSAAVPPLAPPSRQSAPGKRVIVVASKRSGVKGVFWDRHKSGWHVQWREGRHAKRSKLFPVHRYVEEGQRSYEEADAEALRDAIVFREGLVRRGAAKVAMAAKRQSCSPGISWDAHRRCWQIYMRIGGKRRHFNFRPEDDTPEEVERARLAAVERRRELEAEHCEVVMRKDEQTLGMEKKDSGVRGVWWNQLCWWTAVHVRGKKLHQRFRPKHLTAEAIEAARLLAVQWRADMLLHKAAEADG